MSSNPQSTGGVLARHKVSPGETLIGIARQHGVTLKALQDANTQIKDINKIKIGQLINVPSSLVMVTAATAPTEVGTTPQPAPAPVVSSTPALVTTDSEAFAAMDKRGKGKKLSPLFRERLVMLAEALARRGMQTLITDGLRTFAEQDAIFAKGRTKPGPIVTKARAGKSNHNYGLAVDMYPVVNGKVFTAVPKGASVEFRRAFNAIQDAAGEEAERLGLFWGARFSGIVDTPHIQLLAQSDMSPSECLRIFNKNGGSLDAVWAEAEKRVKPLS
ncbi:MAG: M15 family metallopeptidase [Rubrivivax sp.]|nr:M15 family metallopeptidase [Pyrinomonadaceae bacterium]